MYIQMSGISLYWSLTTSSQQFYNLHHYTQDRDKQNRIHLAGTVEQLKKFNSRRRLRAATLAAAAADDEEEAPPAAQLIIDEANAHGE